MADRLFYLKARQLVDETIYSHRALLCQRCSYPLSGEAEERVDQRSVVGVSKLCAMHLR